MIAAALLRVSSNQQELDSQKADIKKAAESMGYEIPDKFYFGEKISGGRPQFIKEVDDKGVETGYLVAAEDSKSLQELKEVVQNPKTSGQISMIFVWEISRISRLKGLLFSHISFFNTLKKPIHFISHQFTTLHLDTLEIDLRVESHIHFLSMYIEEEYRKIKERTQRGKKYVFETDENRYVGGTIPYGYKIVGEKKRYLEVDEEQAEIVKLIFDKYVNERWSFTKIASYLNNKNIRSAKGKLWEDSNVGRLLHNKNYIGERKYGKWKNGKIPPIISIELFNKVKQIIENKKEVYGTRTRKFNYPLKGKIKCGICKTNHWGVVCASRKLYHDEHTNINKFRADAIVWDIIKHSNNLEWYFVNQQDNSEQYKKEISEKEELIISNNIGIDKLKSRKKKLINLVDDETYTSDDISSKARQIENQIKEFNRENKSLNKEIELLQQNIHNPKHDFFELQRMINEAGNDIVNIEYLIKLFVDEIYIYNPNKDWVILNIIYKNGENIYSFNNRQNKLNHYYTLDGTYYTYLSNDKKFKHVNIETGEETILSDIEIIENLYKTELHKYSFIEIDPFTAATNKRVKANQDRWNESYKDKRKESKLRKKTKI
ncbi:MAG: recombinase family protein [Dysgonomonas sp.]|nr:recombinase family protein [Dysgonomonas sp.]